MDWKMRHQNAGVENAGPISKYGKPTSTYHTALFTHQ